MKISNSFNNNFGALFGKRKVVTSYEKEGKASVVTTQFIHPFKDEFKSEQDKQEWLKSFKQSDLYKRYGNSTKILSKEYLLVIEPELPFTKETFMLAKKDGIDLLSDFPDFYAVTTIEKGARPILMYDGTRFDSFV